jgi:DHA1 family multidrug resistance protein-like MFS transporter
VPGAARRRRRPDTAVAGPRGRAAGRLQLTDSESKPSAVDWRRNLAALWFAEFTAIFGFSFAFPFLSIFISQDLGVHPGRDLDLWTAASASSSGLAMAIASPIWGVLGDRYGRKPMLIRSMVGGAITVGLIYFARDPVQLVILRLAQGATSGTVAAATALVAAETPRNRVGWALGVLTSSVALGGAIGPVVGGLAGAAFGLRLVFLAGGILLAISTIPVFLIVRESERRIIEGPRPSTLALVRNRPGALRALAVLVGAQGLVSTVQSASQVLVVLKLIETAGASAASAGAGFAFGAAGVANSVSAVGYTRLTRRFGYVPVTAIAAILLAATVALLIPAPNVVLVVAAIGVTGLLNGTIIPATASMLGLETPPEAQSTVFGINASSVAMGFFIGPLLAGGIAATSSVSNALGVMAVIALGLAALCAIGAREPARMEATPNG